MFSQSIADLSLLYHQSKLQDSCELSLILQQELFPVGYESIFSVYPIFSALSELEINEAIQISDHLQTQDAWENFANCSHTIDMASHYCNEFYPPYENHVAFHPQNLNQYHHIQNITLNEHYTMVCNNNYNGTQQEDILNNGNYWGNEKITNPSQNSIIDHISIGINNKRLNFPEDDLAINPQEQSQERHTKFILAEDGLQLLLTGTDVNAPNIEKIMQGISRMSLESRPKLNSTVSNFVNPEREKMTQALKCDTLRYSCNNSILIVRVFVSRLTYLHIL